MVDSPEVHPSVAAATLRVWSYAWRFVLAFLLFGLITFPVSLAAISVSFAASDAAERGLMTLGPTIVVAVVELRRPDAWRGASLAWALALFTAWFPWLINEVNPDPHVHFLLPDSGVILLSFLFVLGLNGLPTWFVVRTMELARRPPDIRVPRSRATPTPH